jgi:hypothetical protein
MRAGESRVYPSALCRANGKRVDLPVEVDGRVEVGNQEALAADPGWIFVRKSDLGVLS